MHKFSIALLLVSILFTFSCNSPFIPKKKGYEKMTFPSKSYQSFNESGYPYAFEYPTYATIENKIN